MLMLMMMLEKEGVTVSSWGPSRRSNQLLATEGRRRDKGYTQEVFQGELYPIWNEIISCGPESSLDEHIGYTDLYRVAELQHWKLEKSVRDLCNSNASIHLELTNTWSYKLGDPPHRLARYDCAREQITLLILLHAQKSGTARSWAGTDISLTPCLSHCQRTVTLCARKTPLKYNNTRKCNWSLNSIITYRK